jgi:hypothetical protein
LSDSLREFVKAVDEKVIDSVDIETADLLIHSLNVMIDELIKKQEEGVDIRIIEEHLPKITNFILRCQAAYMTYKL